jgi:type I restriction enzyme S subunit
MSSDSSWSISTLENAADFINGDRGKNYPSSSDYVASGIPFVSASDLDGRRIDLSGATFISQGAYDRLGNGKIEQGDILFCLRGSLGKIGLAKNIQKGAIASSLVIIRPKQNVSRDFLYYILSGSIGKTIARELDNGSVQGNISVRELKQVEIDLPSPQEQKAIAHILGTLDDKIELNRKTNETLEAMAKALFKSWFVDFDPVRAKAEGRPTGLPSEISDLFPDSFEDSELGEIPSGWEVKSLDEVAHFLNGLALQKFPPEDGDPTLPVIKIAQLKKGDSIGADRCSTAVPSDYVVRDGDVLFSWSGSLAVDIWCGGDGALNQHLFKVTSKTYNKWFFLQWVKHHLPEFQEIAQGKATTMGHIQRHHLSEAKALIPTPSLLAAMDSAFAPLLDRAYGLRKQSKDLATTRDSLLPKLISGEIRIPDAEKMLEEVGI